MDQRRTGELQTHVRFVSLVNNSVDCTIACSYTKTYTLTCITVNDSFSHVLPVQIIIVSHLGRGNLGLGDVFLISIRLKVFQKYVFISTL